MKVIVTGAGGFIGKHVFTQLDKCGHEPIKSFVDLTTAEPSRYAPWEGAEAVIHCAGLVGGIAMNIERPADLMDYNMRCLLNSLTIAYRSGIKRFVNLGSVCAYPDIRTTGSLVPSYLWDGRPEVSNAPYGIAKRVGMELVDAYRSQYGIVGNNLILANVYGPGVRGKTHSHVIPALIEKFLDAIETGAEEVVVWGDGSAVREFLYVEDAAKAIVDLGLSRDFQFPVNIGSGRVVSIRQCVAILAELVGFKGTISWDLSKPDSRTSRRLDLSEANRLGFTPSTSLEEGLKKTIEWIKSERNSRTPAAV